MYQFDILRNVLKLLIITVMIIILTMYSHHHVYSIMQTDLFQKPRPSNHSHYIILLTNNKLEKQLIDTRGNSLYQYLRKETLPRCGKQAWTTIHRPRNPIKQTLPAIRKLIFAASVYIYIPETISRYCNTRRSFSALSSKGGLYRYGVGVEVSAAFLPSDVKSTGAAAEGKPLRSRKPRLTTAPRSRLCLLLLPTKLYTLY